jgi:hypothetical protein
LYILGHLAFCGHLEGIVVDMWYIFTFLVRRIKKHLATLYQTFFFRRRRVSRFTPKLNM